MEEQPNSKKIFESGEKRNYLYHMVPNDMTGDIIYPLNTLKEIKEIPPELYQSKLEKYANRRQITEQFIPTLKCAWNDVVHLTAINPVKLKEALVEAGMNPREMKFYQVDPDLLDPDITTIYLYQEHDEKESMHPDNFSNYNPEAIARHSILPDATKAYYREKYQNGEKPLMFVGVPHILHKGPIDVSNFDVIVV